MLKKIQEALGVWRTELDKLESQLEKKLQRLAFLQESPLPVAEVAQHVVDVMLKHAEQDFRQHLDIRLRPAIDNPLRDADDTNWRPDLLCKLGQPHEASAWCLLWLLREPVAAAIRTEIVNWDEYPTAGPPLAERQTEIAALEQAIPILREQIESSRQEAAAVGVDVGGLHMRPPVPRRTRDLKK